MAPSTEKPSGYYLVAVNNTEIRLQPFSDK